VVITGAGRLLGGGCIKDNSGHRRDLLWPYGVTTGTSAAELIESWRKEHRNFMRLWEFGKPIIGLSTDMGR
jgi:enoyl-CoA hydratase/carnithine racemase